MDEFIKALEMIKKFCESQEGFTACLNCPAQNLCSQFFFDQPHTWEWEYD